MEVGRWGRRSSRRGSVEDEDEDEGSVAIVIGGEDVDADVEHDMYRGRVLFDGSSCAVRNKP